MGTYYGDNKGFYNPHTDTQGGMEHRKISIVICLSNSRDYSGGNFRLLEFNKEYKLDKGDAFIFRSNLLHAVEPVTSGKRRVLISFMWDEAGEMMRETQYNRSSYTPNII